MWFFELEKATKIKAAIAIVCIVLVAAFLSLGTETLKRFQAQFFTEDEQPPDQQYSTAGMDYNVDIANLTPIDNVYKLSWETDAQNENNASLLILYTLPENKVQQKSSYSAIDFLSQAIQSYWSVTVDLVPAEDYLSGMIYEYDTTFVIDTSGIANYQLFQDVANSRNKEIIWLGQSASKITSLTLYGSSLMVGDTPITARSVEYEGYEFSIDNIVYPLLVPGDTNSLGLQPDETRTVEIVSNFTDIQGDIRPFALDVDEHILVLPFQVPSYYETESYSTVFLDLLHRGLGAGQAKPAALLRLEDVNTFTFGQGRRLWDVYHYLKGENIPFQVALIARYINEKRGLDLEMSDSGNYLELLKIMEAEGLATFVQHGYDHQVGHEVSAIGYEFWDQERNAPLLNDSVELVQETVANARQAMIDHGLPVPDIWETPHYALSTLDEVVLRTLYPLRYEHIPGYGSLPFVVRYEGIIYIPETLGYVEKKEDVQAIEHRLDLLSVFDAPVASFFWHPWRDREELIELVSYVHNEGYEFTGVYNLLDASQSPALVSAQVFQNEYQQTSAYWLYDNKAKIVFLSFLMFTPGAIFFVQKRLAVRQYFKTLKTLNLSIADLEQAAEETGKQLPVIAILVPARNEGLVIGNTIRRLAALDYPKHLYHILIITDERELHDDVERTTKDVATEVGLEVYKRFGVDFIDVVEVPEWYSGEFGDTRHTFKKSTKGRALNYALYMLHSNPKFSDVEMFGVLDADGRLDPDVLKEVAYKRMTQNAHILQGPVFQVSNFKSVNWVGVGAGLELAMHHLSELPSRLVQDRVQFLAGTNYFIDKNLIIAVGGWDQEALVEDAELALRIYMRTGEKAQWLSRPELEQSPPNFSVYRRQRERWARGHLYLIPVILQSSIPITDKYHFMMTILISQFRWLLDVGLPILAFTFMFLGSYRYFDAPLMIISLSFMIVSIIIWDSYGYIYRLLGEYIQTEMSWKHKILFSLKYFMLIPVFVFVQAVPRILAIYNFTFNRQKVQWYKTERTREEVALEF